MRGTHLKYALAFIQCVKSKRYKIQDTYTRRICNTFTYWNWPSDFSFLRLWVALTLLLLLLFGCVFLGSGVVRGMGKGGGGPPHECTINCAPPDVTSVLDNQQQRRGEMYKHEIMANTYSNNNKNNNTRITTTTAELLHKQSKWGEARACGILEAEAASLPQPLMTLIWFWFSFSFSLAIFLSFFPFFELTFISPFIHATHTHTHTLTCMP